MLSLTSVKALFHEEILPPLFSKYMRIAVTYVSPPLVVKRTASYIEGNQTISDKLDAIQGSKGFKFP